MPDTGAPWNIPYVAATDLVSAWPTANQTMAEAIADGLDEAQLAGIGTNALSTLKTDTFSTTSTSYVPVTGLNVTITPTAATSKVLLLVNLNVSGSGSLEGNIQVVRDSTAIGNTAGGSAYRGNWGNSTANQEAPSAASFVILDSPATTSAVTYAVEVKTSANTLYVGRINAAAWNSVSSITAVEVKA